MKHFSLKLKTLTNQKTSFLTIHTSIYLLKTYLIGLQKILRYKWYMYMVVINYYFPYTYPPKYHRMIEMYERSGADLRFWCFLFFSSLSNDKIIPTLCSQSIILSNDYLYWSRYVCTNTYPSIQYHIITTCNCCLELEIWIVPLRHVLGMLQEQLKRPPDWGVVGMSMAMTSTSVSLTKTRQPSWSFVIVESLGWLWRVSNEV
jgi:hypothetical protein